MEEVKTNIQNSLYKMYGISEWQEKSCFLSSDEQIAVLEDIKKGTESDLLNLVRLPFPKFVRTYFAQYPEAASYFKDPTFEYKLFFMAPLDMKRFAIKMRNSNIPTTVLFKDHGHLTENLQTLASINFEDLPRILNFSSNMSDATKKFIYLTQYIDLEEAKRMGLSLTERFVTQGSDGYELEKKLSCLNPAARQLIISYIGLYGAENMRFREVAKKIGTNEELVRSFGSLVLPKLTLTYGEFKSFLGYREKQNPEGMAEYTNVKIRNMDITMETNFILRQLENWELEILSKLNKREKVLYLAAKYMFKTPEALARNLRLSVQDAKERLNKLK